GPRLSRQLGLEELERDPAPELQVLGLVDAPHAALAEERPEPVAPEGPVRRRPRRGVGRSGELTDQRVDPRPLRGVALRLRLRLRSLAHGPPGRVTIAEVSARAARGLAPRPRGGACP